MKNIMVDLETLGTCAGCSMLSIGAVAFSSSEKAIHENEFYVVINTQDCIDRGLHEDEGTKVWWEKQSPAAKQVLFEAADPKLSVPLPLALEKFNSWILEVAGEDAHMWGNGADFDNPILAAGYRAANVKQGWKAYNGRCYRTLKGLYPNIRLKRGGTHHNALDDARTQASHAIELLGRHWELYYASKAT